MAKPRNTSEARFAFDVLKADEPVLVDFHATWCSQCRRVSPVLDDLASDWNDDVRVVKVDIEEHPHLADRYDITNVPTLVVFEAGEERARLVEVVRRPAIEAGLAAALHR